MRTDCLFCGQDVMRTITHISEGDDAKFCNEYCVNEFDCLDEREQELRRKPEYLLKYIAPMWCGERERAELARRYRARHTTGTGL